MVLVLAVAGWLGVRGLLAKAEVDELMPLAAQAQDAIAAGDFDDLADAVSAIAEHADHANALTSDPLWRMTEGIPVIGANTAAVRIASGEVGEVARAAAPLLDLILAARSSSGDTTGIDLSLLVRARAPLSDLASAFEVARSELGSLRPADLVGPVADGIGALRRVVTDAAGVIDGISATAGLAPDMLGMEGTRHVLLILQNPAELRTGGGLTGTFAMLTADAGHVSLREQVDSTHFRRRDKPVLPLSSAAEELYGDVLGRFVQNASMTPDFDLTARLASEWWLTQSDIVPDAVVSIDPVVLASLLAATGPVTAAGGLELTSENIVRTILVDPYMTLSSADQTKVQRAATEAVFEHVLDDGIDIFAWAAALRTPIEQGRVSVWSAHADEQQVLAGGPLAGSLARHKAAPHSFAVYLNDVTMGKMDTLLDVDLRVGSVMCRADGHQEVAVAVQLSSRATSDARTYPRLMRGLPSDEWEPGDIATNVSVAAPEGYFFGGVFDRDGTVLSANAVDDGFPTSIARIVVAPGEKKTLEFRFIAPDEGEERPSLLHTPTLSAPTTGAWQPGCG